MTREEAIEKVRQMRLPKETMEILEALAPELRESEDERIRRILIESFEKANCSKVDEFTDCKLNKADVLAYLKKHKYDRMKPIYDARESFESALGKAWKDYNDSGARTVDGCEDDYVECAHAKGFREGYLFGLEKQKECVADSSKTSADEDEKAKRMLNAITYKMSQYQPDIFTEEENEWFNAYLEKRKERPTNEEMLRTLRAEYEKGVADTIAKYEQKEQNPDYAYQQLIKTVEEEADALYPNPYKEGTKEWSNREIEREYFMKGCMHSAIEANPELYHNWPEVKDVLTQKQKEQKPKIIIPKFRIGEYIKPKPYNEKHLIKDINENGYVLDVDFVVPFKDEDVWEVVEQKPAEWSKEDERYINGLIGLFEDMKEGISPKLRGVTANSCIAFLKSLRPSWKPSKDEERLINTSISFLKDFADKGYENAVECIDWLKSKLNGNSGK